MKKGQKFYCCRCRRLLDASEFYYRKKLVQRIVRKRIETEGMHQLRYMKGGDHGTN